MGAFLNRLFAFTRKEGVWFSPGHVKSAGFVRRSKTTAENASMPASFRGSLTIEAAVALPVFLACMAFLLQVGNLYYGAARFSSAMAETGQEMAVAAYVTEYGEPDGFVEGALTIGYATLGTFQKAGQIDAVRNENLLLSSVSQNGDIDLALTYQMKSPSGLVKAPWNFYVQHTLVRGWTGRNGSDGKKQDESGGEKKQTVYVTDYGSVYHVDEHCTHIHLSITKVSAGSIPGRRNRYGKKYHACEKCGGVGSEVYITTDGDRYHSSLECSGLKRTVHEVSLEEVSYLRPCSRCGGRDRENVSE